MTDDLHLEKLPVRHLEWLFDPPGLPLPRRIAGTAQTTSALVRGAAGTGKTTLALALAVGIADELGGNVYYLSTEIAPVDVRFKLKAIGLEPGQAVGLANRRDDSRILTEHLRLVTDANIEQPGERTRAALEYVQSVVFDGKMPDARVVVIDAFSLVGEVADPTRLRVLLADTIQAFDAQGVSVVLVEEAPVAGADWASFVVDLVFELGWGEDPDTHARIRQLSCPKSRFAPAACGPHDYGLAAGRLVAWPDLAEIDVQELLGRLATSHGRTCLIGESGRLVSGLVGSNAGRNAGYATEVRGVPWLTTYDLSLDGVPTVGVYSLSPHEGPAALVWSLLDQLAGKDVPDVLVISGFSSILWRARFAVPFFSAAQFLSTLFSMVVLHASEPDLARIPATFNYQEFGGVFGPRSSLSTLPMLLDCEQPPTVVADHCRAELRAGRVQPQALRRLALAVALLARQERPLAWYLSQGSPRPEEEPYLRHAIGRVRGVEAAAALLAGKDGTRRRLLLAELHLNRFTPEGLAEAEPVYAELSHHPVTSAQDRQTMANQLAAVRAALAP